MSESEFWDCTPRYLSARLKASVEAEKVRWEQSRFIAAFAVDPGFWSKKKGDFTELIRFPWEVEKPKEVTPEQQAAFDKFSDDADLVYKKMNPEGYERYMAKKKLKEKDRAI